MELFDDKDKVVATMSIRMVLDPGDALFQSAPSREPLQDGEPEISALSLLDETMTCLDKRMRHRCDPNIFVSPHVVRSAIDESLMYLPIGCSVAGTQHTVELLVRRIALQAKAETRSHRSARYAPRSSKISNLP